MTTGARPADDPADDLIDDRRRPGRDDRVRDRRPDRQRAGPDTAPAFSWRWGELSGGRGMLIVVATAVLGAIVTVVTKRDPGSVLGWLIVAGTAIAGFAVRPRSAYLLVPVPALAYVVFGLAAGYIRHRNDPSSAGLAVNAAQWIANGFLIMAAATVLAVVIALGRWLLDRRGAASATGRPHSGAGGRRGVPERRGTAEQPDQADGARSVSSDSSGLIGHSDEVGFGGQRGRTSQVGRSGRGDSSDWPCRSYWPSRGDRAGRVDRGGRDLGEAPGRPKPTFYPNPDWSGDRGQARDPRDRRPPPGPPSFGASRDLAPRD